MVSHSRPKSGPSGQMILVAILQGGRLALRGMEPNLLCLKPPTCSPLLDRTPFLALQNCQMSMAPEVTASHALNDKATCGELGTTLWPAPWGPGNKKHHKRPALKAEIPPPVHWSHGAQGVSTPTSLPFLMPSSPHETIFTEPNKTFSVGLVTICPSFPNPRKQKPLRVRKRHGKTNMRQ